MRLSDIERQSKTEEIIKAIIEGMTLEELQQEVADRLDDDLDCLDDVQLLREYQQVVGR